MAYISFQPKDYFNTVLYTGNNGAHSITGVGFRPDWIWLKPRNYADHHRLMDVVRGQYTIYSNRNVAQDANSSHFTSFDSDGFTLAGSDGGWNSSSYNYVSWNWRAGNSQGSSNTDGSINTTYTSVNTTAGFSISQYTGTGSAATIGHGLGAAPDLVIIKSLQQTRIWIVGVEALGNWNKYLALSATDAEQTSSTYFPSAPTSTVVNLGDGANVNNSSENYIAYCFAEKKGFSKFGKYTGNGNGNGTFIYTGFKPAFVLVKRNEAGYSWGINDTKRPGYNETDKYLIPDTTASEQTNAVDLVSNGFKFRTTAGGFNGSASYIYMAFAAEPLVASNGDPATAR
tara:strand:+ start:306 stop:1331 length:1026 start_codon:yes stop_codon:yes gene_type:complete